MLARFNLGTSLRSGQVPFLCEEDPPCKVIGFRGRGALHIKTVAAPRHDRNVQLIVSTYIVAVQPLSLCLCRDGAGATELTQTRKNKHQRRRKTQFFS